MLGTPYRYVPFASPLYRQLRRHLKVLLHSGSDFGCPVCAHQWTSRIDSASCPYCGSQTRQKALALWLEAHLKHRESPINVLLFAPDFGIEVWLRSQPQIMLTTADLKAPGVDYHWDITALPANSSSYDLILCSHVLEHVEEDEKALSELARLLRPGGHLVLQVPYARDNPKTDEDVTIIDPKIRSQRFGQFDHVRLYGRDIKERIAQAGMAVDVVAVEDFVSKEKMAFFRMWNDVIFVCRRAQNGRVGETRSSSLAKTPQ